MKTIDRYILKQTAHPLLIALAVALLLLLMERLLRLLEFVLSSKGTLDVLLKLLTNLVPHYIGVALPAALFLALVVAFGRLQRDSELDACLSAGFGLHQQLRAALFLGIILTGVAAIIFGFLQPYSRYAYRSVIHELSSAPVNNYLREDRFINLKGSTYMVESLDRDRQRFARVFAMKQEPDGGSTVVTARLASLEEVPGQEISRLILFDGTRLELVPREQNEMESEAASEGSSSSVAFRPKVVTFSQTDIAIELAREVPFRPRGKDERELTIFELWSERNFPPTGMVTSQLVAEFNESLVRIFTMLVLPFFAIPLALGRKRSSRAPGLVFGLLIIITFNKLLDAGADYVALSGNGSIMIIWGPFLFLVALSAYLFYRAAFVVGRERSLNSLATDIWSSVSPFSKTKG